MNITELEKLAKAATPGPWVIDWYVCREAGEELWRVPKSIGPIYPDENHWARDHIGTSINDTNYLAAANPQTILAMIELLREMGEALYHMTMYAKDDGCGLRIADEALAKYKEMTK